MPRVFISRKSFISRAARGTAGLAGILSSGCSPAIFSRKRPNIVLVTMDTQRYDRVGFNGYLASTKNGERRTTTPYLDGLAKTGVVFDRNYSQANATLASIGSMFTSRYVKDVKFKLYSDPLNIKNPRLGKGNITLAERLREEGYNTFAAFSTFFLDDKRGCTRGFDNYSLCKIEKRKGDKTVEALKQTILESGSKRGPTFIYLHLYQPHWPYIAPDKFKIFHTTKEFNEERRYISFGINPNDCRTTDRQVTRFSDFYDGEILWADDNIKCFMEFLEKEGRFDFNDDLFVLTSDHGEDLGDHGYLTTHTGLYDVTTHVPLLVVGGGLATGKRIEVLTMNLDVAPTIAHIAHVKPAENWEGQNLVDLISGNKTRMHDAVFCEDVMQVELNHVTSVVTENLKYIFRTPQKIEAARVEKREGYFPTGMIEFYGGPPESLSLNWPGTSADNEDTTTKINIKGYTPLKYKGGVCEGNPGDRIVCDSTSCSKNITHIGESVWNGMAASNKIFKWRVEVFRESNGKTEIVFDSGPLKFGLIPTPNFEELYDLKADPSETNNILSDPSYEKPLVTMKKHIQEYRSGISIRSDEKAEDKLENLERDPVFEEEMKKLRNLGYLG